MAVLPLDNGDLFAGRYRIVRCIASGGMGAVYEAIHTVTERRCALKVMLGHTVEREKLRERFMLESRLAAQIGSEYIVDVLDAGVDDKTKSPFLVMELLDGEDLAQRIARSGRFTPDDTTTYLWHTALALDRTHRASIVHRDLKASNLFLTYREDGSAIVKVLDFGVAKVMPLEATSEGATQTVGTPIYMAPEQFRADGRVSPATDIYALGMLAYTLLVGVHYWKEEHDRCANPFAFASIAVHGPSEPPSVRAARHGVTLPAEFDAWFAMATSKAPQDRFLSATQAIIELANALGVPPPASSTTGNSPPTPITGFDRPLPSYPAYALLDETMESSSAHLSAVGLMRRDASSAPELILHSDASGPSVSIGEPPKERTEISLSVTSGGLDLAAYEAKRATRRRILLGSGVVVIAIAAIVARGLLRSPSPSAADQSSPSAATATAKGGAPQKPSVKDLPVTSIDQLPKATVETRLPPPAHVKPPSKIRVKPGKTTATRTETPSALTEAPAPAPPTAAAPETKPAARQTDVSDLYTRQY